MEIKVLLCNCKGGCTSFKDANMNTLPFAVESELDVTYSIVHPQLCGQGGHEALKDALRSTTPDTWVIVGACAPEAQRKLFRRIVRETGFDETHLVPVDVRGTDNDGIVERLRGAVESILHPAAATAVA